MAAWSALIGGLVSVIPNGYFAMQAFRYRGARNAQKVVKSFMKGEMGKLAITIVLFVLIFSLLSNVNEVALIASFIAVQLIGVVMSGLIDYRPSVNNS
jgi:ATP synthase protein I